MARPQMGRGPAFALVGGLDLAALGGGTWFNISGGGRSQHRIEFFRVA